MSDEAYLRLILTSIILSIGHILVRRYIYPWYKRIEDRSREKAEARLDAMCSRHR